MLDWYALLPLTHQSRATREKTPMVNARGSFCVFPSNSLHVIEILTIKIDLASWVPWEMNVS